MRVGVHSALTQCCCIAVATAVPTPGLLFKLLMMHCKLRESVTALDVSKLTAAARL